MKITIVGNVVEANGKTVRENNLTISHTIPMGTLVEVNCDYVETHGCRAFVVEHGRDCDGTPLYGVSLDPLLNEKIAELERDRTTCIEIQDEQTIEIIDIVLERYKASINGAWSDDSLIVIEPPRESNYQNSSTVIIVA